MPLPIIPILFVAGGVAAATRKRKKRKGRYFAAGRRDVSLSQALARVEAEFPPPKGKIVTVKVL